MDKQKFDNLLQLSGRPDGLCMGPYLVHELVGEGGSAWVYRAIHQTDGGQVALKVLKKSVSADPARLLRFQKEIELLSGIDHPGIVRVLDYGEHEDVWFYAMEWMPGGTLKERISPRMEAAECFRLAVQIAEALSHAHQSKIIHRDFKPQNILLDESGNAKVADFGLAQNGQESMSLTISGHMVGTPAYLAPELLDGSSLEHDTRTDVYAYGLVLWQMMTGIAGTDWLSVQQRPDRKGPGPAVRPGLLAPVPRELEWICLKCLSPKASKRYPNASGISEDLRRYQDGKKVSARPPSALEELGTWLRCYPGWRLAFVLLTLGIPCLFLALLWKSDKKVSSLESAITTLAESGAGDAAYKRRAVVAGTIRNMIRNGDPGSALKTAAQWIESDPEAWEIQRLAGCAALAGLNFNDARIYFTRIPDSHWGNNRKKLVMQLMDMSPASEALIRRRELWAFQRFISQLAAVGDPDLSLIAEILGQVDLVRDVAPPVMLEASMNGVVTLLPKDFSRQSRMGKAKEDGTATYDGENPGIILELLLEKGASEFDFQAEISARHDLLLGAYTEATTAADIGRDYVLTVGGWNNTASNIRMFGLNTETVAISFEPDKRHLVQFSRRGGIVWALLDGKIIMQRRDIRPTVLVNRFAVLGGLGGEQVVHRVSFRALSEGAFIRSLIESTGRIQAY